jgi:hypothetical protein
MTDRTDDWRTIFGDLIDDSGCYEIDRVNIYQLTSHLEELYLKIRELEGGEKQVKSETITDTRKLELLLTEIKSTAKRKTCYDGKGGGDYYEYSEDQDIIFDDGDRYGRITFARELLESIGESYE